MLFSLSCRVGGGPTSIEFLCPTCVRSLIILSLDVQIYVSLLLATLAVPATRGSVFGHSNRPNRDKCPRIFVAFKRQDNSEAIKSELHFTSDTTPSPTHHQKHQLAAGTEGKCWVLTQDCYMCNTFTVLSTTVTTCSLL